MARENWDLWLSLFAIDWERTGITPEAWCTEKKLKWGSAKRYISIAKAKAYLQTANSQNGTANKTANSEKAKTAKGRAHQGKDRNPGTPITEKSPDTKPNRLSGNPNPPNPFIAHNTAALKHGGYARRMLWSDEVTEDALALRLGDELFRLRAASLVAAENIGRWTTQLDDASDEQRKTLLSNISAAEKAMMRNTVRIESLERSLSALATDSVIRPKIAADTEYKKAVTQKVIRESAAGGGDKPSANKYSPDDYRTAALSLDDEFGDLD